MPLQLLKHMSSAGITKIATFLNKSAIDQLPPKAWRASKVQAIYKGKGSKSNPSNYRSIAITPPFTKLFMATMNQRLTAAADRLDLHAPTQAGFRAHHGTTEQALILQTIIQHSLRAKRKLSLAFIDLQRAYDSIDRQKLW
jgi:Reverse transcriptase (RNA-dependent DNA polymerase)